MTTKLEPMPGAGALQGLGILLVAIGMLWIVGGTFFNSSRADSKIAPLVQLKERLPQQNVSIPAVNPPTRRITKEEAEAAKLEAEMAQARATRISAAEETLKAAEKTMAIAEAEWNNARTASDSQLMLLDMPQLRSRPDGTSYIGADPRGDQLRLREAAAKADYEAAKRAYTDGKAAKEAIVGNQHTSRKQ